MAAALLGAPVFVAMGGIALLLFFREGTPVAAVSAEVYRLVASETLPAIPLLTAAGYILAEGGASTRLVRFFRALFGWMPGGIAILVAAVCALFTTFTGGSGVTIIALGGVYAYCQQLVHGLVTTGMTDQVSWGLYIANFTYLVGLAAAAAILLLAAVPLRTLWSTPQVAGPAITTPGVVTPAANITLSADNQVVNAATNSLMFIASDDGTAGNRTFVLTSGIAGKHLTLVWSGVVAFVSYKIVDIFVGLRVAEDEEREGLDIVSHGESAYHN